MRCPHLRGAFLALCLWSVPSLSTRSPHSIQHHKPDLDHHHTQGVPHIIHQSWKTREDIPERFHKWQASWRKMHPTWEYRSVKLHLVAALGFRQPWPLLPGSDRRSRACASSVADRTSVLVPQLPVGQIFHGSLDVECLATRCRLWSDEDNLQLVEEHFPWFLETYNSFTAPVMRADSCRILYMYHYGGDTYFASLPPLLWLPV